MTMLLRLADRVLNRPLLITPDKAQVILSVLSGRIGVDGPDMSRFEGTSYSTDEDGTVRSRPYKVSGSVAIITITGSMVNRGAWVGASSGLTSYEGIQFQMKAALADSSVQSVILDLSTPGGEAIGAFETAAIVRQLAASKRTIALVNGMAASAGYAIASGASEIVTTESGISGSIGVVMLHADMSRAMEIDGIKPTLIFAGAHKVDGNPFEPLPKEVRADLQAEVDGLYSLFVKSVAEGRGARLTEDAARSTEARIFFGQAAVEAGVADRVGSFEGVLAELQQKPSTRSPASGRSTSMKGKNMDTTTGEPAAEAGITKADLDKAVAAAVAQGLEDGRKAESARIAGIEANSIAGFESLIAAHKADAAMTPEKSAVAVLAAIKAAPQDVRKGLAALDKAAEGIVSLPSGDANGNAPKADADTPDGWKAEFSTSKALQEEFGGEGAYVAFRQAEAGGKVRILKTRSA